MRLTRILGGIVFFALLHNPVHAVQSVTLAWDPSPDLSVVGYNIQYGVASRTYTNKIDIGNATSASNSGLVEGMTYFFAATAYNTLGQESVFSNEASYTVPLTNNLPTITLTSPFNGAGYTPPATINLAASVIANGHSITKVQFYNSATLLGEDTSGPYSFIWNNVSPGSYNLAARAVYDTGSTVGSSPVNINVTSNAPPAGAGLAAAYGFNEGTGTTVGDASGSGNSGTVSGTSWTTTGRYGKALSFNGTSSYVNLGNPTPLHLTGSMTLETWVLATGNPPNDGQIIAKSDSATTLVGWQFKTSLDTGVRTFGVAVSPDGSSNVQRYSKTVPALNTWYHVAGVYNASARTLDIYVNGVLDDGVLNGTVPNAQFDPNLNVAIGRRGGGYYFNGTIDEVRVYNRALSQAEIQSDMNAAIGAATNTAPTISSLASQMINEDSSSGAIGFAVGDAETAAGTLVVSGSSSNPGLLPSNNIVFGGSGSNRTMTVTAAANQSGTATLTVSVSDGQLTASTSFGLTVSAVNDAPTISGVANQTINAGGTTGPIPFAVGDVETAAGSLTVSGSSSNPGLVPAGNIVFGGSGSNRTVTVNPASGQTGSAVNTVTVSDGLLSSSTSFTLMVNAVNPAPTVALTSPLNGASYTAPANISLAANVTANGHSITKVQFYNGATLLGEDPSAPYSFTWSNGSPSSYSLSARAVYDAGSTVNSSPVNINVTGLAAPWQTADIGSVGVAGSASLSNGNYTVAGAGNISGTADNFRFVYQPLSGDGEIKVRLNSVDNTGPSGRIGVIIRESLTSGAKYAFMGISPDGTFRWQRRSNTGSSTSSTTSTIGTPPAVWLRLVRTGNTLYGYRSTDGASWTLVSSRSITMATNIYVGLAVASGSSATLNTAVFINVTVVP